MIIKDNKTKFKEQLKLIEIELFSYCNRKCWFCPNSYIDRHSKTEFMMESGYQSILSQLKEIEYSEEITYSRYNEPLSKKEVFLRCLKQARDVLPHAKLRTNTNGDFVTLDYIFELRDAGLNELFIQQYLANRELYNHDKLKQIMIKKLEKLGVDFSIISDIKNHRIEFDLKIPGITVHLRSRNFEFEGTTRTKIVSEFNKDYTRTSPCKQPFNNMYIDYNGTVMVCCNSRSDIAEHENGIMGSIYKNNLWDIYFSDRYNYWREHLKDESPKKGICKECKIDIKFEEFL